MVNFILPNFSKKTSLCFICFYIWLNLIWIILYTSLITFVSRFRNEFLYILLFTSLYKTREVNNIIIYLPLYIIYIYPIYLPLYTIIYLPLKVVTYQQRRRGIITYVNYFKIGLYVFLLRRNFKLVIKILNKPFYLPPLIRSNKNFLFVILDERNSL